MGNGNGFGSWKHRIPYTSFYGVTLRKENKVRSQVCTIIETMASGEMHSDMEALDKHL